MGAKNRQAWWNYIKQVIREYPALCKEADAPLEQRLTAVYGGIGGSAGAVSRPVENCVIHDLSKKKQRKLDAIETAIRKTQINYSDADLRLTVINLVYWKKTHTIAGAALKIPCHVTTAGRWQADFIWAVAEELELP